MAVINRTIFNSIICIYKTSNQYYKCDAPVFIALFTNNNLIFIQRMPRYR